MKFPICQICMSNNMLCRTCQEQIDTNHIMEDEIYMYKYLDNFFNQFESTKEAEIKRAIINENILLIITTKEDVSKLIGRKGNIAKKLGQSLNKQIRIIPEYEEPKDFLRNVLFSVNNTQINEVFTKEGKEYKIIIPKSQKRSMPFEIPTLAYLFRSYFDNNIEVEFE